MKQQSVLLVGRFHIESSWLRRSCSSISYSVSELQGKQASAKFPCTILCVQAEESINICRKITEKKRKKLFEEDICEVEEAVESDEELTITVLFQKTYGTRKVEGGPTRYSCGFY